jgi:hypothetical protein
MRPIVQIQSSKHMLRTDLPATPLVPVESLHRVEAAALLAEALAHPRTDYAGAFQAALALQSIHCSSSEVGC